METLGTTISRISSKTKLIPWGHPKREENLEKVNDGFLP
jgi:hypothetical protein